jgi:trypsin-like peptidase
LPVELGTLPGSYHSAYIDVRARGEHLSHATGFLCLTGKGPMLVTARHVVTGRDNETGDLLSKTGAVPDQISIRYVYPSVNGAFFDTRVEELLDNEKPRWRHHPELGPRMDCVALPLADTGRLRLMPYDFNWGLRADSQIVYGPSDPVSVVGYPFGQDAGGFAIWATGFVASEPRVDYNDLPIMLIDCRSRPGQSGSPVILQRNSGMIFLENGSMVSDGRPRFRFLGVYSGRINSQSDIGIVWKASAVRQLL